MSTQNAVVALIHDRLGTALKDFFQLGQDAPVPEKLVILIAQEQSLLEQLQEVETTDDEKKAPNVTFGLVIDIVGNSVSSLLGQSSHIFNDPAYSPVTLTFTRAATPISKPVKVLRSTIGIQSPPSLQCAGTPLGAKSVRLPYRQDHSFPCSECDPVSSL